jgi:ABC-type polysaccharide/polyol phosphate transport system ATPase subunit
MNKEVMLEVKGVKASFVVHKQGLGALKQFLFSLGRKKLLERKQILKGIDLTVYKGDCIGLLGKNGSGKSTFLRAITGVVPIDKGTIQINGRLAPMLSLGAGLEREMSGIENIRLICTLVGISQKDIDKSMQEIIDFSELGDAVNMEIKRYSSGMMSRLAFSTIVATNPEILIVDEALAVGDKGFKNKCLNKIDEFRSNGTTILYVSHQFSEVKRICNRVLWLKNGVVHKEGTPDDVGEEYLAQFNKSST